MNSKKLIKQLKEAGWRHVRTVGSHYHFKKEGCPYIVTVPHPKKDLPIGTVNDIKRKAGL